MNLMVAAPWFSPVGPVGEMAIEAIPLGSCALQLWQGLSQLDAEEDGLLQKRHAARCRNRYDVDNILNMIIYIYSVYML